MESRSVAAGTQVHDEGLIMSDQGEASRSREPSDVAGPMADGGAEGGRSGGGGVRMIG